MKRKHITRIALLCTALAASAAHATPVVNWSSAIPLAVNNGIENPLVLFGFNPQPEPPARAYADSIDPTAATREVLGIEPTPFIVFLAANGGRFDAHPPDPGADFDTLSFAFTTFGGSALEFRLTFTPEGDGDLSSGISDPLFFNPQPEPPARFLSSTGFQFAFDGVRSGEDVSVRLQILDDTGDALPISVVPAPAAPWLLGTALLGLLRVTRRRVRA